jgi:DNA-binding CsgD family transcriptional regulator
MTGGSYGAVAEGQRPTVTARPSTTETNSPSMNSGSRRVGVRSALEAALETDGSLELEDWFETIDGDSVHATAVLMVRTTAHVTAWNDRLALNRPSIADETSPGDPEVPRTLRLRLSRPDEGGHVVVEGERIPLTKQELRLLQLLANGATSREAAAAFDIDLSEIRARLTTIFEKVRANNGQAEPH